MFACDHSQAILERDGSAGNTTLHDDLWGQQNLSSQIPYQTTCPPTAYGSTEILGRQPFLKRVSPASQHLIQHGQLPSKTFAKKISPGLSLHPGLWAAETVL